MVAPPPDTGGNGGISQSLFEVRAGSLLNSGAGSFRQSIGDGTTRGPLTCVTGAPWSARTWVKKRLADAIALCLAN
jgi:hypothetical protein